MARLLLGVRTTSAAWFFASALACGPAPTYHRDVEPIVRQRCTPCHDGTGVAPFIFNSYDDVYAAREMIKTAVVNRTMPPWQAGRECAELAGDWSLTDFQIATISQWVEDGAPRGPPGEAESVATALEPGMSRVDLSLEMPEAYTPPLRPSDYRCFLVDWPLAEEQFITGFRARPGNEAIVHHAIAYVAPPEYRHIFAALDADDDGPGYECRAGPGFVDRRVAWVGAWEPGGTGDEYPDTTGFAVVPGSTLIVQMHYDPALAPGQSDRTTFELKLEATVAHAATVVPWADPAWITTDAGMLIPAGTTGVVHSYESDPTPLISRGRPFMIRGVSLHMHERGQRGGMWVKRRGGGRECVLDIPRWDFSWQQSYILREPIPFYPGDRLGMECQWDNAGEVLPAADISWGGGTSDEMCLGTLVITIPESP